MTSSPPSPRRDTSSKPFSVGLATEKVSARSVKLGAGHVGDEFQRPADFGIEQAQVVSQGNGQRHEMLQQDGVPTRRDMMALKQCFSQQPSSEREDAFLRPA